jgi:hypothetical protein
VEVALVTAVVSAHPLYKKIRKEDISITKFREEIVMGLLNHKNAEENANENRRRSLDSTSFKKMKGSSRLGNIVQKGVLKRKWEENSKVHKVTSYSEYCVDHPHYCLHCFSIVHYK